MKKELTPAQQKRIKIIALIVGILVMGGLIAAVAIPMVSFASNPDMFRDWVAENGFLSAFAYIGMVIFQILAAFIPGEPFEIVAGYAFGTGLGTVLCLVSETLGSIAVLLLVRKFGIKLIEIFFSKEKIESVKFLQSSNKKIAIFALAFICPGTPKDLLCYFGGITNIPMSLLILICSVGRFPSIITSILGGDAIGNGDYTFAIIVFAITIAVSGLGLLFYNIFSKKSPKKAAGACEETPIENVVIVGMGALGLMYAGQICSDVSTAPRVTFLMDEAHYKKTEGHSFTINSRPVDFARALPGQTDKADLLIVATKTTALAEAVELMKSCVDEHTIILSVCNGISSEEFLGQFFDRKNIVYSVAQGMDAVKLGDDLRYSTPGTLYFGAGKDTDESAVMRVKGFFEKTGVRSELSEDIMLRMWKKFMLNCGINQACMVYNTTYGAATVKGSETYETFVSAMREVEELAKCEGYNITDEDVDFYIHLMETMDPDGMPSMAQDRICGRPSEVETFSGTVIRCAQKYGLEVPVNRKLYEDIKKIEAR